MATLNWSCFYYFYRFYCFHHFFCDDAKGDKGSPGILDPRYLQERLVSMEKMVPKVNLELRALLAKRGSAERVEQVEFLGLQV